MVNTRILCGDAREKLKELPDKSVQMCVTSPPYFALRSYGGGQLEIGIEQTPEEYIQNLVTVFREVKRVLKDDGTLWLNIGDSYVAGTTGNSIGQGRSTLQGGKTTQIEASKRPGKKPSNGRKTKDLIGIPWMLAFALRTDGWYLRQDIIWEKLNPMPESVTDRCTKSHEHVFLLANAPKYYFDHEAMQEPAVYEAVERIENPVRYGGKKYTENPTVFERTKSGNAYSYTGKRNKRDVWRIPTTPYAGAHFATFPESLVEPCILAGSRPGDTVLDPFNGAGTTGVVCVKLGRNYIGTELNPEYVTLAEKRIEDTRIELEYGIKVSGKKNDTDGENGGSLFDEAEFVAVS